MRPDRIIVGEVRGGEALDMLQAMNTGHDGSLSTAHANSCRHLLWRLETMAMMSDVELPAAHIRNQVASAIDVVVQLARLRDGRRVVWEIAAVEGTHRGEPVVSPLYRFRGRDGDDGEFEATGSVPRVADVLADRGEDVGDWLFEEGPDAMIGLASGLLAIAGLFAGRAVAIARADGVATRLGDRATRSAGSSRRPGCSSVAPVLLVASVVDRAGARHRRHRGRRV